MKTKYIKCIVHNYLETTITVTIVPQQIKTKNTAHKILLYAIFLHGTEFLYLTDTFIYRA